MVEARTEPTKKTAKSNVAVKLSAPVRWLREFVALVLWGVLLTQIFVFDIIGFLADPIRS